MIDSNCLSSKLPKSEMAQLLKEIEKTVSSNETVIVALKGTWKEFLICTDLQVYVIKRGMMTGHTFGGGVLKIPYHNITNAEVVYRALTGYFEISAGGLDNKHYTHYQQGDPSKQPNCISITPRSLRKDFEAAANIIMSKVAEAHNGGGVIQVVNKSASDEIREYKSLFDDGIITEEEFERKKKELLSDSVTENGQKSQHQKHEIEKTEESKEKGSLFGNFDPYDPKVLKAVEISLAKGKFSTAMLQTYLGEGHSVISAFAIWLEEFGVIGPINGKRPRDLLITSIDEYYAKVEEYIKKETA